MRAFGWLRRLWERYDQLSIESAETRVAIAPPPEDSKDTALVTTKATAQTPVTVVEPETVIELPPAVEVVETGPEAQGEPLTAEVVQEKANLESEIAKEIDESKVVDTTAEPSRRVPLPPRPHEPSTQERAHYFTPAQYSGKSSTGWLLSPDMAFQLRKEAPRQLAPSSYPGPQPQPAPATPRARNEIIQFFTLGMPAAVLDPAATQTGAVVSIDPVQFTTFMTSAEGDPGVSEEAFTAYLASPMLLGMAASLRGRVLRNFSSGKPPLTAAALVAEAASIAAHLGTALVLCHNVAKAFSRGGTAVAWIKSDRLRGEYTDGENTYRVEASHPHAIARPAGAILPSIFYLLFSSAELGLADPGDWYRYFGFAALAWYTASGNLNSLLSAPYAQPTDWQGLARRMMEGARAPYPPLAWANAVSFWEGGGFSRSQKSCAATSRIQLRGARFGIEHAGRVVDPRWRWYVPKAGSIEDSTALASMGWTGIVAESLDPIGGAAL